MLRKSANSLLDNNTDSDDDESLPTTLDGIESSSSAFIDYYPAIIENTNGTLVTVSFPYAATSSEDSSPISLSQSLPSSLTNLSSQKSLVHSQQTFDVGRDSNDKYALVEDAAPQTDKLEKLKIGHYVLYKCTSHGTSAGVSLSHSSTPTTPTSPDHTQSGSNLIHNQQQTTSVRFRLGKIADIKLPNYFRVEPVYVIGELFENMKASSGGGGGGNSPSLKQIEVKRPNLRLIEPPWYMEFEKELGLKSRYEIQRDDVVFQSKQLQQAIQLQRQKSLESKMAAGINKQIFFFKACLIYSDSEEL